MKKILILLLIFGCSYLNAQLVRIEPIKLSVNYTQTVHLLFPSKIKYFSSVGDFVAIDNPEDVPFLLRCKAQVTDFNEVTNLTVATSDGKFYDFSVVYQEHLPFTNLFLSHNRSLVPEDVGLNNKTETHIVFPNGIKYIDIGELTITANVAKNTRNILRVKANEENKLGTNISVVTDDDKFYTYNAYFTPNPVTSFYASGTVEQKEEQVLLKDNDFTDSYRKKISENISEYKRHIYSLGEKRHGIVFSVLNIFIHENFLFFRCEVNNTSSIPYNIEYTKFTIIDRKKAKLTATQQLEQPPIYVEGYNNTVFPKSKNVFTLGFETFTIPDEKYLRIELNEKNGGRHIHFHISNKDIINGQVL